MKDYELLFEAIIFLAEGLYLNELKKLNVENFPYFSRRHTRIPTVSRMERQLIFPIKSLVGINASGCSQLE
jgi:hypothetical protein